MAGSATTNYYLHSSTKNYLFVQFKDATTTINNHHVPQPQHDERIIMSSRQAIFAFIATVLLNFLQIKYQNKDQSPFETHPKTIFVAISSLFLYCFSYDAYSKLSIPFPPHNNNNNNNDCLGRFHAWLAQMGMVFFGPLSLASMSSVLFPESITPLLFFLSIFYSFCQLLGFSCQIERLWNFLRAAIMGILVSHHHQHHHGGRGRLVSVDEIDILPLPPV